MATERSNAGDPARTLKLLWDDAGEPSRRGPSQGRRLTDVVDAAIRVADAEGLDAVTMRRVARALDVAPMTLYTYVPGKAELLDLMLDHAYRRMAHTDTSGAPWRERLSAVAAENRALFEEHPWTARISTVRPPLGPGAIAKYERELSTLDGLGLGDVEMDAALTHLLGFVRASAQAAADVRAAQRDSAMSDQQWWEANAPLFARVFDESRYPTAARVGSAAGATHGTGFDPDHAYHFGLARILDGLAALIER